MKKMEIVLPKTAATKIEAKLVELSKQIRLKENLRSVYGLGGVDGYGYDYENNVFMMKPYCWCEKDNCKWCNGDAPNFLYKPTNTKISWYKWIGRDQRQEGELPNDWFETCIESLWEKDGSYFEFYEDDWEKIWVKLCFNVWDENATVKAQLSDMAEFSYRFWSLDEILNDIRSFTLSKDENKEYKKALTLDKKYPALREKIKKQAIKNCKEEIERLKRIIKEYSNKKKVL